MHSSLHGDHGHHGMYLFQNSVRSQLASHALSRLRRDVIADFNSNNYKHNNNPKVQFEHQTSTDEGNTISTPENSPNAGSLDFNFKLGSVSVSIPSSVAVILACVVIILLILIPYIVWRVKKHARSQLNPILSENYAEQCQRNRMQNGNHHPLPPPKLMRSASCISSNRYRLHKKSSNTPKFIKKGKMRIKSVMLLLNIPTSSGGLKKRKQSFKISRDITNNANNNNNQILDTRITSGYANTMTDQDFELQARQMSQQRIDLLLNKNT